MWYITKNTKISVRQKAIPIEYAAKVLQRDICKCCQEEGTLEKQECELLEIVTLPVEGLLDEMFIIRSMDRRLVIEYSDILGAVYGLYEVSRRFFGITPFWFWNDQVFGKKIGYEVEEDFFYKSTAFAIRYRGWFINDEVLLHAWYLEGDKDKPWEMALEALLRLGGNMVIPGTDGNAKKYAALAWNMGLYVTHHHAEPLGAEMFARAYPQLEASFDKYQELFQKLWKDGIEKQKEHPVIWNIGFRGQGDCPFWANDPRYDTAESRGALMSKVIGMQYQMVKSVDEKAVCCTNLYGETMELYQEGYLKLPEDVIKIWADNGYGKMVSRRQNNHNPRVYALPLTDEAGAYGIYYHASFYDLQAANHMTMLPNSLEFVKKELKAVLEKGVKDFWIINSSNIKPHVYTLDFIANLWKMGEVDVEQHRTEFVNMYFSSKQQEIAETLRMYHQCAVKYGEHEDEHAGEQFTNHVARILVSQFMKNQNERAKTLLWATDADTLEGQVAWYQSICQKGSVGYKNYRKQCEALAQSLSASDEERYRDSILLQAIIHEECFTGAAYTCDSILAAGRGDYKKAFYFAGLAKECYESANGAMRNREHDKWKDFYANECLTDMKQTAWLLKGFMTYLRNMEDGPHFYQWQREFLYEEKDRKVLLLLNVENHLTDEEMFSLMKTKWRNSIESDKVGI